MLGTLLVGVLWSTVALWRHWALESHAWDLGIFVNGFWNLTHGNGYVSNLRGLPLLADHQAPSAWLFAPVFALFPRAETLLVLQSLVLASAGAMTYRISRQYQAGDAARLAWLPWAVPILYWCWPGVRSANAFDFHPECLLPLLMLSAIAGLQSAEWHARLAGALALLLALGTKESAGPLAAGIGLAWVAGAGPPATREFTRRAGIGVIVAGVCVFAFDLWMVPKLLGRPYAYGGLYAHLGQGFWSAIQTVLGLERWKFLLWTLGPLAFLPLAQPRIFLLAAGPAYAMLFLSEGNHRLSREYHYALEVSVPLFWALPGAALRISEWGGQWKTWLPRALAICAFGYGLSEFQRLLEFRPPAHARWVVSQALPCVHPKPALRASERLLPHLSAREWAQGFEATETPPGGVLCAVLDSSVGHWPLTAEQALQRMPPGLKEVYRCGSFGIFAAGAATECMSCRPSCEM